MASRQGNKGLDQNFGRALFLEATLFSSGQKKRNPQETNRFGGLIHPSRPWCFDLFEHVDREKVKGLSARAVTLIGFLMVLLLLCT